ncbi:hypothetical protein BH09VER1_BH09VER1_30150 [soil metagenome]
MDKKTSLREIVIAAVILVALVAIVATIMTKNKGDATRLASFRNMQQWGIALNLYLIDNENQLPEIGQAPVTPEQKKAWYNALPPYISQKSLADLPAGERPRPGVPSLWIDPESKPVKSWDPEVFFFNYGMNKFLQPVEGTRSFRINEINFPSNIVFLVEVNDYNPGAGPEEVDFPKGSGPKARSNVLFCDGHVQAVDRQHLVDDPAAVTAAAAEHGISWFQQ